MILTQRFFLVWSVLLIGALVSVIFDWLWWPVVLGCIGLVIAVIADGASLLSKSVSAQRILPHILTQGQRTRIGIQVANRSDLAVALELCDSPPGGFEFSRDAVRISLAPGERRTIHYMVFSQVRGTQTFGPILGRLVGRLGLVLKQVQLGEGGCTVDVFPDVSEAGARELAVALGTSFLVGRRPLSARGEGREFESLRLYRPDDDFRQIDWKASAKNRDFIARHYQAERDQRLLIMIDLGRSMTARVGKWRKLDYAVGAAVRLAQLALYKGDLVGLLVFSDEVVSYQAPRKGLAQLSQMVRTLANCQPVRLEPNYQFVCSYAARRNTKRTFMVCFSDLADMAVSRSLLQGLTQLQPRHLPLVAAIRDTELQTAADERPANAEGVYRLAAAREILTGYERTLQALRSYKVDTVSVPAGDLTLGALRRYVEIKQSARL